MLFRSQPVTRRSPRQWWNSSVQVFTRSAHLKAVGVNISSGGMCLFAVANLPVGSQIEVEFQPPDRAHAVRHLAVVRHRALYLYGVEILQSGPRPVLQTSTSQRKV